jgi:hypothetical protein
MSLYTSHCSTTSGPEEIQAITLFNRCIDIAKLRFTSGYSCDILLAYNFHSKFKPSHAIALETNVMSRERMKKITPVQPIRDTVCFAFSHSGMACAAVSCVFIPAYFRLLRSIRDINTCTAIFSLAFTAPPDCNF